MKDKIEKEENKLVARRIKLIMMLARTTEQRFQAL